ncbi:hypothetical protein LEP1GSC047_2865 [Leptospira inadai serovar Lyme str. 10]|uniref:Uncharacterized protein n=1 Tax=Leptospira inadai serovar Lyme str. 10 TaxID=1049790 RepID=V6HVA9_9LEPT|nr:hypothetical protein LEP1GSC047_2865 [Leptospira inadai serovar Lyme str. 10]
MHEFIVILRIIRRRRQITLIDRESNILLPVYRIFRIRSRIDRRF